MVTGFEKQIYNCYLANVRGGNGHPFKLRKKWKGFEDDPNYYYVKKLAYFFRRHDNINIDDFFKAPFEVYPEPANYDLKFYITMKAIKCYRIHKDKNLS